MGTLTQDGPAATIVYPDEAILSGSYTRAVPDALGELERIEIDLYTHTDGSHTAEQVRWHFLGNIPRDGVLYDGFLIPLTGLAFETGVSYCWRVRLRDRLGVWTAWEHQTSSIFATDFETQEQPTLTYAFPIPLEASEWSVVSPATPSLATLAGFKVRAIYTDPNPSTFRVEAQLIERVTSEAWTAGVYSGETLLWYDAAVPFRQDGNMVTARYSGRELRPQFTYLWRMRAVNSLGVYSNYIGGEFYLEDPTIVIPGDVSTMQDAWTLLWQTDILAKPVGVWYKASDSGNIRAIDRQTKYLCILRQSDRALIGSDYIGGICSYPAGLSGDPATALYFWMLQAPWTSGAGLTGNYLLKVDASAFTVTSSFALASGRWTSIKVSALYVWAANWDTGLIYKINKTTGATIASYTISYGGEDQTQPTGIMVDGTTLYMFFNGTVASRARILVADESDPTAITRVIDTGATAMLGGEMDTTTHTEMFWDSDTTGLVGKYTMTEAVLTDGGPAGRWLPATTTYGDA